jgi:hypothetical protein
MVLSVLFFGCDTGGDDGLSPVKVTKVTIGGTLQLTAAVDPDKATNKTVAWKSDKPNIVSVDEKTGEVKGEIVSEAVITATAGGESDTVTITVADLAVAIQGAENGTAVAVGRTLQLTAAVTPAVAKDEDKAIIWISSDVAIADVSAEGLVSGKTAGSVTITATTAGLKADRNHDTGWSVADSSLYPKGVSAYEYIFVVSRTDGTYTLEARNSEIGAVLTSGTRTTTGSQASASLAGAVYVGFMLLDGTVELSNWTVTKDGSVIYKQNDTDPGFTPVTPTGIELSVKDAIPGEEFDHQTPIAEVPAVGIDITATITPADATGGFEWTLTGTGVTVDQTGHVTVTVPGDFTVTAISKTTPSVMDSFSFSIIEGYDPLHR